MAPVRPPPRTPDKAAAPHRRTPSGTPAPRTRGHGLTRLALGIIALTTLSSCDLLRSDSGIVKRRNASICHWGEPHQIESVPQSTWSAPSDWTSMPRT